MNGVIQVTTVAAAQEREPQTVHEEMQKLKSTEISLHICWQLHWAQQELTDQWLLEVTCSLTRTEKCWFSKLLTPHAHTTHHSAKETQ